jgi:hypothetical protein
MPRPLLLLITAVLGIASIAAALAAASLSPGAISNASTDSDGTEAVLRYYDAVNHMIATGDPGPLREAVDREMLDLEAPDSRPAGREGIEDHLSFLHAAVPDARIEPDSMVGDVTQITAHPTVLSGTGATLLGFSLDARQILWPAVEVFHVRGGRIIERRASWEGLVTMEPVHSVPYDFDIPDRREMTAQITTYAPRATGKYSTVDAPNVMRLLSGELAIALSAAASDPAFVVPRLADGRPDVMDTVSPGQTARVAPGDVVIVPTGSGFTITNQQNQSASLLHVSISIEAAEPVEPESLAQPLQSGVQVQTLSRLLTHDVEAPAQVHFGTATLMSNSRLTIAPGTKLLIACSDSATPRCVNEESVSENNGIVRIDQFIDDPDVVTPLLLLTRESGQVVLVNAGTEPATAWTIAVSGLEVT